MKKQASELSEVERAAAIIELENAALNSAHVEFAYVDYLDDEYEYDDIRDILDEDYRPQNKKLKSVSSPSPTPSTSSSSSAKRKKKNLEYDAKAAICKEVRKHPAIYQITHKDYMNKPIKDAIREQISQTLMQEIGPIDHQILPKIVGCSA